MLCTKCCDWRQAHTHNQHALAVGLPSPLIHNGKTASAKRLSANGRLKTGKTTIAPLVPRSTNDDKVWLREALLDCRASFAGAT